MKKRIIHLIGSVVLAATLPLYTHAATFIVTSSSDSGPGTLRQAIADANASPGLDNINFSGLTLPATIDVSSGEILITESVGINGPGYDLLTIDMGEVTRCFNINSSAVAIIFGLRFKSGNAGEGSAIYCSGTVTIDSCLFDNNYATLGGALKFASGSGIVTHCVFKDNYSLNYGGAIDIENSDVSFDNCSFENNSSVIYGGAAYCVNSPGIVFEQCTFTSNSANLYGGAIANFLSNIELMNCTFYNNNASNGSSLLGQDTGPENTYFTLRNVTLAGSTATSSAIFLMNDGGVPVMQTANSIFDNTSNLATFGTCYIYSDNNNICNNLDMTLYLNGVDDLNNSDPLLLPLANNGGYTKTCAIQCTSPAIDAANALYAPTLDQRGEARYSAPDIGAYENTHPFPYASSQTVYLCDGESYTIGSNSYSSSGTYEDTLMSVLSCDSIVTSTIILTTTNDQVFAAYDDSICRHQVAFIDFPSSQVGVNYYLRDDSDNSILASQVGTGGIISFTTPSLLTTTTFNVLAQNYIGGVDLPATDDRITFSTPFVGFSNEITVEAWVKLDGSSYAWGGQSAEDIDDMMDNVWLWHNNQFFVNDGGNWRFINFPSAIPSGWTHIATVASSTGMQVYFNGVLVASDNTSASAISTSIQNGINSFIILGQDPRYISNASRNSNCAWDNFMVWNSARTGSEILSDMYNCFTGNEANLVQYTQFNEKSGITMNPIVGSPGFLINPSANWIEGSDVCDVYCNIELSTLVTVHVSSVDVGVTASSTTLTANASGLNYQWVDCDLAYYPISGATNQSFTATANGNYAVIVNDGSCLDTSACFTINSVGIDELSATSLEIFPNPASTQLTINSNTVMHNVCIKNLAGQMVYTIEVNSKNANVDVSTLPNGVYAIETLNEASHVVSKQRLVISR